jgi:hypothetical protein
MFAGKFHCFFCIKLLSEYVVLGKQLYDERNTNKLTQKILNDRFVLPTARGSAKPSIEFSNLLQGLLVKEPGKRYN